MLSYFINKHIELVLEKDKDYRTDEYRLQTNIYVNANKFFQCKFLVLPIPTNSGGGDYDSIDEYVDNYGMTPNLYDNHIQDITPEEEF